MIAALQVYLQANFTQHKKDRIMFEFTESAAHLLTFTSLKVFSSGAEEVKHLRSLTHFPAIVFILYLDQGYYETYFDGLSKALVAHIFEDGVEIIEGDSGVGKPEEFEIQEGFHEIADMVAKAIKRKGAV